MNIPEIPLPSDLVNAPVQRTELSLRIGTAVFKLTAHGRRRYLERSGRPTDPDMEVLRRCLDDPRAVWKLSREPVFTFRLVTYLSVPRARESDVDAFFDVLYEDVHDGRDRPQHEV